MKCLIMSALVFSVILNVHPASGAIDLGNVTWEVTDLDYSRARADSMRYSGDFDGALEAAADILSRAPGDGFALRTLALVARDMGELSETAELLERGEKPPWLDGVALEEADREFLLGLVQYYRGRSLSAFKRFEAAIRTRPGWGWPVFYLGRSMEELLRPWEECEEKYKEALADPSVVPAVVDNLLLKHYPHRLSAIRESAVERMSALPAVPWLESADLPGTLDELGNLGQMTPEEAARWWMYMREHHRAYLLVNLQFIASLLTRDLTPAGFDEFTRMVDAEGYEKRLLGVSRADRFLSDDRPLEASLAIDSLGITTSEALETKQEAAIYHGSPREVLEISFALLEESIGYGAVYRSKWINRGIGDRSLDSLLSEARRENPSAAMKLRIDDLKDKDSHAAAALIDSLLQSGVEPSSFLGYRIWMEELRENSDEVEAVLSQLPLSMKPDYWLSAAAGAMARGDREGAVDLIRRSFDLFPRSVPRLLSCMRSAMDAGDRGLVEDLLEALTAACPECPATVDERIAALMWLRRNEEAADLLAQTVADGDLSPKMCSILTASALALREHDLADTLLARAERAAPASPLVRGAAAMVLSERGEAAEAREILEGLVADFPASEGYRSRLLSVGGSVQQADIPEGRETAVAFDIFGHDLESTDWLIERAARADTMKGADAVFLLERVSCVADGVDRAMERNRNTIYLRTEAGVDIYQPYEISFNASEAIPKVRMARVIRRDGTVIQVPGTDILVKADEATWSDVDDSRALVIPFPGLEPGTVIDVVYDTEITSWYTIGWSRRYLLPEFFPVLEEIVELAYAPGRAIHTATSSDVPVAVESEADGRILRTWKVEDIKPMVLELSSPDYYDVYPWVGISTHESVEASLEKYRTDFWARIEESDAIRKKTNEITREARGKREKFDAIFAYVVKNVMYVAIELREGRIIPSKPSVVMEHGYGDCKDMVALLISMLEAAGFDAEPFLVTAGGGAAPVEGFPEPFLHDHVIVRVPSLDSLYADPTSQDPCPVPLPASLAGAYGIALPREGHILRARIPEADPGDHGFTLEGDLRIVPGNRARLEIKGVYRGELADAARKAMASPDSADGAAFVQENLGYGLWDNCRMVDWDLVEESCAQVVLEAVFEDSSWSEGSVHSMSFPWRTEVADPVMFYPSPGDRELPLVMPFPFECEAVIRLHDSPLWEAKVPIPVKVAGAGYEGSMTSERRTDNGASCVEVSERFRMEASRFDGDGYEAFWNDWVRFVAGVYQTYTYRRSLDREELERIENYVRTYPDDAGFAMQAALQILGEDAGGEGEAGRKRREAVRAMVSPHVGKETAGSWPAIILAGVEINDGRYRLADSLVTMALEMEPGNQLAQLLALAVKDELGQLEELIDLHKSLLQRNANKGYEISLIANLQEAGRSDEVEGAVNRYRLLYGDADSLAISRALVQGALRGHRCGEADSIFAFMKAGLDEMDRKGLESAIDLCHDDLEGAAVLLEEIWEEQPFNEAICNNLAWCYVLLGRDLERAEELTELAVLASSGSTACRNTLATIYARRGEWERARPIYVELRDTDDRPESFDTNEFFVGLCDYQMGREKEALERWRKIAETRRDYDAAKWSDEALRLDAEGESVLGSVFKNLGSE
jgi:tetratricopeptide (TPR) repeat protein